MWVYFKAPTSEKTISVNFLAKWIRNTLNIVNYSEFQKNYQYFPVGIFCGIAIVIIRGIFEFPNFLPLIPYRRK